MKHKRLRRAAIPCCLLLIVGACKPNGGDKGAANVGAASGVQSTNEQSIELRKMPAGKEFSGFLKDYSNLKPNPALDSNAITFARADARKNVHQYIAVIVEPVQVYLASDADGSKLPDKARGVGARYFHKALVDAVSSAFPVTDEPGPLVLRLRSALIGVDVGGAAPPGPKGGEGPERKGGIGKRGVA